MTFKVGTTPNSQWQALAPLLESLGWNKNQKADPETWYHADPTSANTKDKHLLLHTRPEIAIAHAMEQGESPTEAVEEWRTAEEHLVAFYKRNRANTVVIEVTTALQEPRECFEAIRDQLGLNADGELPKLTPPTKPQPLNQLLANQLIRQSCELSHLLAEAEACTLPLTDEVVSSPTVEIQELYQQLRNDARDKLDAEVTALKAEQLELKTALEEAKDEAELNLLQLSKAQEQLNQQAKEIAQYKEQMAQLQQERNELQQEVTTLKNEQTELKKSLEEAKEEGELTLHQLFQVQEHLEKHYLENKDLQKAIEEKDSKLTWLRAAKKDLEGSLKKSRSDNQKLKKSLSQAEVEIKELTNTLDTVHGSASWKLTKPLRAAAKPFSGNKQSAKKLAVLIEQSPYFDANWYLKQYKDVAGSKWNPAEHYIMHGAEEGRDPSPLFSTRKYLEAYVDVAETGTNPLVHFVKHGESEGRNPKP
ncbi:hypothetical protein [Marinimicrobium sp. ABcell2]|uniref:hypothetical protein n=1 Tax=Marinimicrobium sp. ABcell2 TaxID=3069751 RepID=UPI0027B735C3|nr:hypothetical protein [Marinimicrobium sp. ABcell2]MDQ2078318.1 hypothetical protein [Marinimicrobium sp. ABcell2]